MEEEVYQQNAKLEDNNWWHVARRKIIETTIEKYIGKTPSNAIVLDIGCGSGGNFDLISKYYKNIYGVEASSCVMEIAKQKYPDINISQGDLPDNVPFSDNYFDIIFLLDVLEHIEDDSSALKTIFKKLKPGGYLILTVPAFNFLWSHHDEINHHKRRYSLGELTSKIRKNNFKIKCESYFNTLLFPLIALVRLVKKGNASLKNKSDIFAMPGVINSLLTNIMSSEKFFIRNNKLPFGVSIIVVAQKFPDHSDD